MGIRKQTIYGIYLFSYVYLIVALNWSPAVFRQLLQLLLGQERQSR